MSRWLVRVQRFGLDYNWHSFFASTAPALCALLVDVPLRAYQSVPGRFSHPAEGDEAPDAIIGRITRAWWGLDIDGVMATAALDDTPRALVIDHGMRVMHARGILSDFVGVSIRASVRFSIRPGSHPLPIHGIDAVHAVDIVNHPAAGGYVIRPLAEDEDPTAPAAATAERNT